jgi:hypothetical protein
MNYWLKQKMQEFKTEKKQYLSPTMYDGAMHLPFIGFRMFVLSPRRWLESNVGLIEASGARGNKNRQMNLTAAIGVALYPEI